jgi:hypothetical protein
MPGPTQSMPQLLQELREAQRVVQLQGPCMHGEQGPMLMLTFLQRESAVCGLLTDGPFINMVAHGKSTIMCSRLPQHPDLRRVSTRMTDSSSSSKLTGLREQWGCSSLSKCVRTSNRSVRSSLPMLRDTFLLDQ